MTNGTLIDDKHYILLSKVNHINISIDEFKEIHEDIRGKIIYHKIDKLFELKMPYNIQTVMTKDIVDMDD